MKLQISALADTNRVSLVGDLDIYCVEEARETLLRLFTDLPGLELDLGGVETCDTAGLQLLLATRRNAMAAGKSFANHPIAAVIEKCGVILGVHPDSWRSPAG
jgi:anti-anti-sigma factor